MVPGVIVIGDTFVFSARNATTGRDHTPSPSAVFTWSLVDKETRDVEGSGELTIYEGSISSATTEDLTPGREYVLRVTMLIGGKTTTRSAYLRAVYDLEDAAGSE